jgi:TonB family protein
MLIRLLVFISFVAPIAALLSTASVFLLPSGALSDAGSAFVFGPGMPLAGLGAICTVAGTILMIRLVGGSGGQPVILLINAALPWLAGIAWARRSLANAAAETLQGPLSPFLAELHYLLGTSLSVGLLGAAGFGLAVTALLRGAPGRKPAGALVAIVSAAPLVVFAVSQYATRDLAAVSNVAGLNPLSVLLALGLAGAAVGQDAWGETATLSVSVPIFAALSFVAATGLPNAMGAIELSRASSAVGAVPVEMLDAVAAELANEDQARRIGALLAAVPIVVMAVWARARAGPRWHPARTLALLVLAGVVFGADWWAGSPRLQIDPQLLSTPRQPGDTATTAPPPAITIDTTSPTPDTVAGIVRDAVDSPVVVRRVPVETTEADLVRARPVQRTAPVYPETARRAGIAGTVTVEVMVDSTGAVQSARAISGHPLLAEAATAAVREWRFEPARRGGRPVASRETVPINFVIPRN